MKQCFICNNQFEITAEDRVFYEKIKVPEPRACPLCRDRRRKVFRNENHYYSRNCDLCQKPMISVYDPAAIKNVYCLSCWWSDKWDPKSYARDYDFNRSFMDQYLELHRAVPKVAMMNDNGITSENCEYTYDYAYGKNSYLIKQSWLTENCMYGRCMAEVKDSLDSHIVYNCQLMYNCCDCWRCYGCQECRQCRDSTDCYFSFDLKNCKDCILSAGLRNRQYYIWNKPHTKEEYEAKKKELGLDSWQNRERYRKEFAEFIKPVPRKYANFLKCEDCTGDNLDASKNALECYMHRNLHNCKYMYFGDGGKDSYDCICTGKPELCYDSVTPDNSYNDMFVVFCWKCQFVWYSDNCHSSSNLLGCVGLRKSDSCIFNRQYSKEEFILLRDKIVEYMKKRGEWGEFFPPQIAPFAYNESMAGDVYWYPLSKAEAAALGYRWQDQLPGMYGKKAADWSQVPDLITGFDGLLGGKPIWQEVLECQQCHRNFKLMQKEFAFYQAHGVPIPRRCPHCRDDWRKMQFNPCRLWSRQCDCAENGHEHQGRCPTQFQTTFASEKPEKVYCEKCYLNSVG